MTKSAAVLFVLLAAAAGVHAAEPGWGTPEASVVPEADGFITIPGAAIPPSSEHTYKAVFNATRAAGKPDRLVPAINMAGSELNALAASGVPLKNAQFVLVFHGAAIDGILNEETYKSKYGISNPNLPAIAKMRAAGVRIYVCGQNLAFENFDKTTLAPDVVIASDALIVLMTFQNQGYALLSF